MNNFSVPLPLLVADIGGTNIRFALGDDSGQGNLSLRADSGISLHHIEEFTLDDEQSLDQLVKQYLNNKNSTIKSCCFAIAGPLIDGQIKMTNHDWEISTGYLNALLKIDCSIVINDFEAIAYSVPHLNNSQRIKIGGGTADSDAPIAVLGPGTGLGGAQLIPIKNTRKSSFQVIACQAGHVALDPQTNLEQDIFNFWRRQDCRINREFFISGIGIKRIYEAIIAIHSSATDTRKNNLSPAEIQQKGCSKKNLNHIDKQTEYCRETMLTFCRLLGSAAGDQVLSTGARGGLILAGGILPRFADFLIDSDFRNRFEDKGQMSEHNRLIPTQLILEPQPGLLGAAACLYYS